MLIDSYKQESNYKRKYKLVNIDEGIDLIPFIKNRDLSYSKFEQEKDGSMSANSMSFTLTFPYSIDELFLEKVIKKNDNIVLFEDTENGLLIFDGIAEAPKIKRDRTHIYLTTEIKDKTYSLYEMKHVKEEFFQNIYLCNTSNKTNSLIHQIAYRLGFKDEELDLPDFTTIIPFVLFKKDELIIKELAYAVRLIGGVFTIENRKLVVRAEANRITETYTFDSRNILSEINIDPVYQNYEKLKITYDYYFEKDLQDMWVLVGENGNLNDANIVVRAGQDRKFSVDWLYNVDLVKNYELYEAIFTHVDGTVISFPYTLDIDETGGTLTLDNTANNYDVYVKKFKIRGIPLFMQQGNESYYPSNIDSEKLLNNLENKFVQNPNLALLYLKANYNDNCKMYRSINFTTNVNNFLEPCRKIYLNHVDFTGYIIIEKIDFQGTKMSIQAREYLEATNINDIKTIEKSSVDEYEVISNKFLTEKGLYEADLPLAPQNLLLISQALGFTITFDNFSSNLRGHFVYLKKKTDVNWMKFFINSNNYFYQTTNLVIYEVKVSSVNINGKEGETTEIKEVIPLLLNNGIIDYPEGLSPNDISSKVKSINENLEIVNSGFDSIQQEYNKIQEIVQEVDIEAISNKVKTITKEAIEIFSANEFRRTLGTRVSTIDYNKNIDELQTIDIDSDDLKEVLIEDYYSSIYQNAKQIFSVVKSTEEQQSVIQQLLNKITLLVQKDSENYSLIEQLSDGLTIAVKKDDIISTINQTAEEIQINAKRISLGHGVAVEDDKLIVVSIIGNNFMIGKGVLNKDSEIFNDGLKLYGSSPRGHLNMVANTDTGEFTLETKGHIDFKNDFNRIFLNPDTPSKSQILINVDCFNSDGSLKSEYEGVEFQVGRTENTKGYMKFDDDNGLEMNVKKLQIEGKNILNYLNTIPIFGLEMIIQYGSGIRSDYGLISYKQQCFIVKQSNSTSNGTLVMFENVCNVQSLTYDICSYTVETINSLIKVIAITIPTSKNSVQSYRLYTSYFNSAIENDNKTPLLLFSSASIVYTGHYVDAANAPIFVINDVIYYTIQFFNTNGNCKWVTYKCTSAGVNSIVLEQTLIIATSSDTSVFKFMLFKCNNYIYVRWNKKLYKTQDMVNFTLVSDSITSNGSQLVYFTDNTNVFEMNVVDKKLRNVANSTWYTLPEDLGYYSGKTTNYFYFRTSSYIYMTQDFIKWKKVYKKNSDSEVYAFDNAVIVTEQSTSTTNSNHKELYQMIGYTFGMIDT